MENQHQKITGYRDLTQSEVSLMNEIKEEGAVLEALLERIGAHVSSQLQLAKTQVDAGDHREYGRLMDADPHAWMAQARASLQNGLMQLTRAVGQPTSF